MEFSFYADDMLIKLWDWEKKWSCSQVFEGHTHYVMQIVINPKDNNQFASASLDRTIKVKSSLMLECSLLLSNRSSYTHMHLKDYGVHSVILSCHLVVSGLAVRFFVS